MSEYIASEKERLERALIRYNIPDYMHGGVVRYVMNGIEPGGFLKSVIKGDLYGAVARGDDANVAVLKGYAMLFYNDTPGGCWGDEKRMLAWIERGGLLGKEAA